MKRHFEVGSPYSYVVTAAGSSEVLGYCRRKQSDEAVHKSYSSLFNTEADEMFIFFDVNEKVLY